MNLQRKLCGSFIIIETFTAGKRKLKNYWCEQILNVFPSKKGERKVEINE